MESDRGTIFPKLFIAVLRFAFNNQIGIKNDKYFNHLSYTVNIVIISSNLAEIQYTLTELEEVSKWIGLEINFQETKFMTNLIITTQIKTGNNGTA